MQQGVGSTAEGMKSSAFDITRSFAAGKGANGGCGRVSSQPEKGKTHLKAHVWEESAERVTLV